MMILRNKFFNVYCTHRGCDPRRKELDTKIPGSSIRNSLTRSECEYLRFECNFTDQQLEVFDLLVRGKSIVQISMAVNASESTVSRRIRDIKAKIEKAI